MPITTAEEALGFAELYGVVLESARGPVPNLAEAIVGEAIAGSWWSHPKSHEVYRLTMEVRDSPDILVCRLVGGKVTLLHRRLWPALVRMAERFDKTRLAAIREEHSGTGAHKLCMVEFPDWVPEAVRQTAREISRGEALAILAPLAHEWGGSGAAAGRWNESRVSKMPLASQRGSRDHRAG